MNQWKNNIITGQIQEQYIEDEECSWILAKPRITMTKKKGPIVSIATSIGTWQRNAKKIKKRIQGNALDMKEWIILQKIAKRNSK